MPDLESDIVEVVQASPEIVYQQDKASIDMQISTAKAYPRNIKRSIDNSIAIVTMDEQTAKICTYSLPRGGKSIGGPSVHLAKILAQQWGNMRIEAKVVAIDDKQITSQAVAFDLENNLAIKVEVKRSIVDRYHKRFNDDMITVTGNAANAIALRNAIFAVIPRNVVDKVYNTAMDVIAGDVSDETKLVARRKKVFDEITQTYKVTEEEVLTAIGKAAVSQITRDDIVTLVGIYQAIKDGDTTVDTAFRGGVEKVSLDDLTALYDSKKKVCTPDEQKEAERIIDGKEERSYKKLRTLLQGK